MELTLIRRIHTDQSENFDIELRDDGQEFTIPLPCLTERKAQQAADLIHAALEEITDQEIEQDTVKLGY